MFTCICGKEFQTQRALNAHQVAHKKDGTRYSVTRKKDTLLRVHKCLYCDKEFNHSSGTRNKFCSLEHSAKYVWEYVSKPKIKNGLGGNLHRYLREDRGEKCELCGQGPIHNNKPLVLQVDHIDGDSDNNKLENVRLLCPNCHTQTDTYGSKGKGNRYKKETKRNKYLQEYKAR